MVIIAPSSRHYGPLTTLPKLSPFLRGASGKRKLFRDRFKSVWRSFQPARSRFEIVSTNVTSERSFSAMRQVKTYLRSTMRQERPNNLMLLHVHNERTDLLKLAEITNEFVIESERRLRIFYKFK